MADAVKPGRRERGEVVIIEAAVGYEDADERFMQVLDILAEYGARADTKETDT